jgi:porin
MAEDVLHRDKFTGNWGGLRSDMSDYGLDFDLRFGGYYQAVASGGIAVNDEPGLSMDYIINLNLQKLGLWEGGAINMHANTRSGGDILPDVGIFALPNAGMIYPLPGDYDGTQVTGLSYSQLLFNNRLQFMFGKLNVLDLATGLFPKTVSNGVEGFWNLNAPLTATPFLRWINISVYGGGLWTIRDGMASTGVVFAGQENVTTTWDIDGSFNDGVGILAFQRFNFKINGMPGYVFLIGGGSTKEYPSLAPSAWLRIPRVGPVDTEEIKPWGAGAYMYQVLWQHPNDNNRRLQALVGGSVGDDDPSFSNSNLFASLEAFGPLATRPNDRMGVSVWSSGIGGEFENLTSDAGLNMRDMWGVELYYNFEIIPSVHISPDIQFLRNEFEGDHTAIVPGVRTVIEL